MINLFCYEPLAGNEANPEEPTASCVDNPLDGGDVFYRLNALAGDTLMVTATGPWAPVVYVVDHCDSSLATCLAASSTWQDGDITTTTMSHIFAADGTYYLVVDGLGGDCGGFTLTGSLRGPVTGVGNDPPVEPQPRLVVAPNPTSGAVVFTSLGGPEGAATLRVFDATGRKIFERELTVPKDGARVLWDGRDLTGANARAGVYLALLETQGYSARAPVTIVR